MVGQIGSLGWWNLTRAITYRLAMRCPSRLISPNKVHRMPNSVCTEMNLHRPHIDMSESRDTIDVRLGADLSSEHHCGHRRFVMVACRRGGSGPQTPPRLLCAHSRRRSVRRIGRDFLLAYAALLFSTEAFSADVAQEGHRHGVADVWASAVAATSEKPFGALLDDATKAMQTEMRRAPMDGAPDHDFAAMMIPHHQGAIDMAKAELLYGKNPALRRLAQEIIVTQRSEIAVMQSELDRRASRASEKR